MQINKTILKEYKAMALQSFSDGQIEVEFPDENNLTAVKVVLKPNDGLYKDGKFEFDVTLPEDYPNSAPSVTCKTKIFHPNINYGGSICFNILSDEWDSDLRLVDYVHSLLWLLYQPNLNSRLNGDCPQDEQEFARLVRKSITGGQVAGEHFPCALADPSQMVVEPEEPRPAAPAEVVGEPARPAAPVRVVHEVETRSVNDLRAFFNNLINANQPIQLPRRVERTPAQPQPQTQPDQPEQPTQPREEVPHEQPVATTTTTITTTTTTATPVPTRDRVGNLPAQMRWAQFILPSIQQEEQRSRANNTLRNSQSKRWAPVSPPIRFVGSMRVY